MPLRRSSTLHSVLCYWCTKHSSHPLPSEIPPSETKLSAESKKPRPRGPRGTGQPESNSSPYRHDNSVFALKHIHCTFPRLTAREGKDRMLLQFCAGIKEENWEQAVSLEKTPANPRRKRIKPTVQREKSQPLCLSGWGSFLPDLGYADRQVRPGWPYPVGYSSCFSASAEKRIKRWSYGKKY